MVAGCSQWLFLAIVAAFHYLHCTCKILRAQSQGPLAITASLKYGENANETPKHQPLVPAGKSVPSLPAPGQPLVACADEQKEDVSSRPRSRAVPGSFLHSDAAQGNLETAMHDICKNKKLAELLEVFLVPGYETQYQEWYRADGWIDEAFVNYFANKGAGGEKYLKQTELLIESVHRFSSRPIVAVNFGPHPAPAQWKTQKNLILLQAVPLPEGESFNYNKFRAMLMARVRTGIELDSDQLVARGVDHLFLRTSQEVTKAYPYPILPVHWMSKDDDPAYPNRPYKDYDYKCPNCPNRTMRWGHAHPTWTHWALPFIGNLLDKYLEKKMLGKIPAGTICEDEDALNIGLWAVRAQKQWCKFDIPFVDLFAHFFTQDPAPLHAAAGFADPKWFPHGIPLVFYTAHDAKDPVKTKELLEQLTKPSPPDSIYYDGKFYPDALSLKTGNPDLRCLI